MKKSRMLKGFTTMVVALFLMMMISAYAFAATTYIVKDGAFQNTSGFINAGEAKDGTITGPGNWTQLNLGDANAEAPYLHVIVKATGDTAKAQIAVSDLFTFNLSDLGVTLTEEYQDVVLPVKDKGIDMLSWLNLMGLDGGTCVYTVKDVFLSDDANSTLAAAAPADTTKATEAAPAESAAPATEAPKTGSTNTAMIVFSVAMIGCGLGMITLKKVKKAF